MIEFYARNRIGWDPGKDPCPGAMAVDTSKWTPRRDHNLSWQEYCKKYEVKERSTYLFNMSAEDCCKMINITDELLESFGEEYARIMYHSWDDENGTQLRVQLVDEDGNEVERSNIVDARGTTVKRPPVEGESFVMRRVSSGPFKIPLAQQIEDLGLDKTEISKLFKEIVKEHELDKVKSKKKVINKPVKKAKKPDEKKPEKVKEIVVKTEVPTEPNGERYEVYVLEFVWEYGPEKEEVESIKAARARRQQWEETFHKFTFTDWKLYKEVRYREEVKF